jgi:CBS domain-containing protein
MLYMKVRDVMTKQAVFCGPETNLAQAVEMMWKDACGFLPVVGEGGHVIGVITDRDISIALGTRDRRASEVHVHEVMPLRLLTCTADDNIHTALKTLGSEGIRRLPVIDRDGTLDGVLSIDDIVLTFRKDISCEDFESTYKAIVLHESPGKNARRAA